MLTILQIGFRFLGMLHCNFLYTEFLTETLLLLRDFYTLKFQMDFYAANKIGKKIGFGIILMFEL